MPDCPVCATALNTVRHLEGVFYLCPKCEGRALTISHVRHAMGDRLATALLRLIKDSQSQGDFQCPFCRVRMLRLRTAEPPAQLDACRACAVIWLDLPTYGLLPQLTNQTTNSIPMQATEILAINRLREEKERAAEARKKGGKPHRAPSPSDTDIV